MKKICYITTISSTIQAFILKSAIYLHEEEGWDISIICNDDAEFAQRLPEFIHYYPVKMERGIDLSGIKALLEMLRIFKSEKFDLIQYSTPNASFYAAIAGWLAKIPVRLYCQWGMVYVGFSGIKRQLFKFIEKMVCTLSTWIEPDSKSNLEFAHKEGLYPATKGYVIWNGSACGIDLNKFNISKKEGYRYSVREKYHIPEDAFVFGFVGRITKDKGMNELFNAFMEVSKQKDNVYLILVGAKESDETIDEALAQWSKKSDKVIYAGFTDVVEQYLSAMDCFVLPSYREGFGMGTVEAEAMSVPVIVTNIPGPIDAMKDGETGIVVEKASVTELKEAMLFMCGNPQVASQYGNNGYCYVKDCFEQKTMFEKILIDRKNLLQ